MTEQVKGNPWFIAVFLSRDFSSGLAPFYVATDVRSWGDD